MTRLLRGLVLAAGVLGGGLLAAPAGASEPGVMKVHDGAKLFSADGVEKAKAKFEGTTFKSATHFAVVTAAAIPADKQAEFKGLKDKDDRGRFFQDWARQEARSRDRKGDVLALVYMDGKRYWTEVVSDEQSDRFRGFNDARAKEVSRAINAGMKAILDKKLTGDEAKKEADAALLAATNLVIDDLKDTSAPDGRPRATKQSVDAGDVGGGRGGSGIMGWLCIGLCVLAGVWLVVGLVRAFTGGGGGGGYGPGGGYGGGYGGGGGGGFFSSLLGGMFGAAAGMYLYDNFFGGHHSTPSMGSDAMAADGGNYDTGDGNYDTGAAAGDGGGDWDNGGGDAGGGGDWGGDAGGGGDFGGGGDWGGGGDMGGGGDFGGGGDW
jgi:uncharacterized protein